MKLKHFTIGRFPYYKVIAWHPAYNFKILVHRDVLNVKYLSARFWSLNLIYEN